MISKPNQINAYTIILLEHAGQYLLLQRAATKRIAPNRWTGVGGRIEADEYADTYASALRELAEETGFRPEDITFFGLRRVLLHNRPDGPLTLLLYYTGLLTSRSTPLCPEGSLHWVSPDQLADLEIIETTRPVLSLLIEDMQHDPTNQDLIQLGLAIYDANVRFLGVVWGEMYQKQ